MNSPRSCRGTARTRAYSNTCGTCLLQRGDPGVRPLQPALEERTVRGTRPGGRTERRVEPAIGYEREHPAQHGRRDEGPQRAARGGDRAGDREHHVLRGVVAVLRGRLPARTPPVVEVQRG